LGFCVMLSEALGKQVVDLQSRVLAERRLNILVAIASSSYQ